MADKKSLENRIQAISWALIFIIIAVLWLLPGDQPNWLFFIPVGLVLIGMNIYRLMKRIKMSVFGLILGVVSLIIGLTSIRIAGIPIIPVIIIVVAVVVIFDALFKKR